MCCLQVTVHRFVEFMIIYRNLYLSIYFLLQRSLLTQSVSLTSSPQAFYVSVEIIDYHRKLCAVTNPKLF